MKLGWVACGTNVTFMFGLSTARKPAKRKAPSEQESTDEDKVIL